jgi:ABC-type Fe3+-hydroxamate transport system substrate-binding protein
MKLLHAENVPQRIVSLVPSQTELLHDLGLNDEVVGITKFCVHPEEWFRTKPRIGGTKNINMEKIVAMQPDLVIANKEENVKEQVEILAKHTRVHVTNVNDLHGAINMIRDIGFITATDAEASILTNNISEEFEKLHAHIGKTHATCAYLIWKEPLMTVGGDTFISDILAHCGLTNAFDHLQRYPVVTLNDIRNTKCDYVFLSSEPYPFKEPHQRELMTELPQTKVHLVDGEMFSWYGSRLTQAPAYFARLLGDL